MLAPLEDSEAQPLAAACAAIDPWARMSYADDRLARFFLRRDPAAPVRAIRCGSTLAGAAVVRYPWLKGPYLEFLAVLPGWQSRGIGAAVLGWMEREAAGHDRNLWVLASDFNERAIAFYARYGFRSVAPLPDLAVEGFTEILLRKHLVSVRP